MVIGKLYYYLLFIFQWSRCETIKLEREERRKNVFRAMRFNYFHYLFCVKHKDYDTNSTKQRKTIISGIEIHNSKQSNWMLNACFVIMQSFAISNLDLFPIFFSLSVGTIDIKFIRFDVLLYSVRIINDSY